VGKILVIDDDDAFRSSVMATLKKQGFDVLEAASGAVGVQMARAHQPDLVLCDVNMGGVGGNLTLYALRRDLQIASIPFILMSGFSAGGETPAGIERGADGFLAKPFNAEKLLSTIQECLNRQEKSPFPAENVLDESSVETGADSSPGLLKPVNRILEIARLLSSARRPKEPKDIIELAGQAHRSAVHLRRKLENCLVCAEIERLAEDWQRPAALEEHRTGFRAVVEPVAREKAVLVQRTADLASQFEDAQVAISAERLTKIAEELLDNAFRYSHPGSAVHLKTTAGADTVTLSISDHGCGMTQEQIIQAVTPIPLDQVLLARHGSGLGLFIAKRLTELHSGIFNIHSEPGRGTTVMVSLRRTPGK